MNGRFTAPGCCRELAIEHGIPVLDSAERSECPTVTERNRRCVPDARRNISAVERPNRRHSDRVGVRGGRKERRGAIEDPWRDWWWTMKGIVVGDKGAEPPARHLAFSSAGAVTAA